nr:uncharacterized protein LOC128702663 [Cherax quadricarinatus]
MDYSRWYRGLQVLLLLLFNLLDTQGKICDSGLFSERQNVRFCVLPLEEGTKLVLKLMLKPSRSNQEILAGSATIKKKLLSVGQLHNLTVQHYVGDRKHSLRVELDGEQVTYKPTMLEAWQSRFHYSNITLCITGNAEIKLCPRETIKPSPHLSKMMESTPFAPITENETFTSLPSHSLFHERKVVMLSSWSTTSVEVNSTTTDGEMDVSRALSFLLVLGEVGGVPVVVLLLVSLLVGLLIGVISVLLCIYCRNRRNRLRRERSTFRRTPVYADTIRGTLSFLNRNDDAPDRQGSSGFNSWSSRIYTPFNASNNNTAERKYSSNNTAERKYSGNNTAERKYNRNMDDRKCSCNAGDESKHSNNNTDERDSLHNLTDRAGNFLTVRSQHSNGSNSNKSTPRGTRRERPEISYPIIEGTYSVPHFSYSDAELIPLTSASTDNTQCHLDENTQIGTFRYIKH